MKNDKIKKVEIKHRLKIWPSYYQAVKHGQKTFELRNNDRGFQCGDVVILKEFDPVKERYTKSIELKFKIGYVLPVNKDTVVFSLLPYCKQDYV